MNVVSIQYTEWPGTPREWALEETLLGDINLIVGKNASGKTRLINVLTALALFLRGESKGTFGHMTYTVRFVKDGERISYELETRNAQVVREKLTRDDKVLLSRDSSGVGEIWAQQLGQSIPFQSPPGTLAAAAKVDTIQHPFLGDLLNWAESLRTFQFGTSLGRDTVLMQPFDADAMLKSPRAGADPNRVTELYIRGYSEFGVPFDHAVLSDLESLGYPCTDVGAHDMDRSLIQAPPFLCLFVQESDLRMPTEQLFMSQGMFRVVALVIHLNYVLFRKLRRTVLIDDVGEGLDFTRAQSFISLLIDKAKQNGLQLIMTTNDRFVMNGVPLEYWSVIKRKGHQVHVYNKFNSPKVFEDFRTLGLSNFDFFSTDFFEAGFHSE